MLAVRSVKAMLVLHSKLWTVCHVVAFYTLVTFVLGSEMCTKSVAVHRDHIKKVHVLRRVPAPCSNWEKAWSWLTKKDCGTKYRLDLVDIPTREPVTYRIVKTCCEGDTKCKSANGLPTSGLQVSDEKFLAIVLGSTAAAIFVLVLIISISLCRKKKQCPLLCEEQQHIYASADEADESAELQGQKCGHMSDEETENKICESEYAEITDSELPRYTDIFKEEGAKGGHVEDPFTRATAPPICTYVSGPRCERVISDKLCMARVKNGRQQKADTVHNDRSHTHRSGNSSASDAAYYNVTKEKLTSRDDPVFCLSKDVPILESNPPRSQLTDADIMTNSACHGSIAVTPDQVCCILPKQNCSPESEQSCSEYEQLDEIREDKHEYLHLGSQLSKTSSADTATIPCGTDSGICTTNDSPTIQVTNGHIESPPDQNAEGEVTC